MSDATDQAPASMEEADRRRNALTLEIQRLQAQMGEKTRVDETGRRLGHTDYWAWRDDAQRILTRKLGELRELKSWIKAHTVHTPPDASSEAVRHLANLHGLVVKLHQEQGILSPPELLIVDAAGLFLRHVGAG